ncbi:MAG TPA: glycosyltransferase family 39 protein [Patescibacteria group bacterium]|nr:glycosyltransferase family 39 protein [Patescibacteria group bacterium]
MKRIYFLFKKRKVKWLLQNKFNFLLLILLIIFLAIRIAPITSHFIWRDENFIIRWGQIINKNPAELFVPIERGGYPPFFPWIVAIVLIFIKDPLIAGRLTSIVGGVITAVAIYYITLFFSKNKPLGILSVAIFTFLPYSIVLNSFALTDNLVVAMGTLSILFVIYLYQSKKAYWIVPLAFSIAFAMMSKTTGVVYLYLLPLILVFPAARNKKMAFYLVITFILTNLIYSFLKLSPMYEHILWLNGGVAYTKREFIKLPLLTIISHTARTLSSVSNFILVLFPLSYALLLFFGLFSRNKSAILFLLGYSFFPLLIISAFSKSEVLAPRHIYLTTITLIPIVSLGLFEIVKKFRASFFQYRHLFIILITILTFYTPLKFAYNFIFYPSNANVSFEFEKFYDYCQSNGAIFTSTKYFENQAASNKVYIYTNCNKNFDEIGDELSMYLEGKKNITIIGGDCKNTDILKKAMFPSINGKKFVAYNFADNFKPDQRYQLKQSYCTERQNYDYRVYEKIN